MTYPSRYEGFGNALLEAIFFRKPLLVNRYKVFVDDIEPLGFNFLKMDGRLDRKIVHRTEALLADKSLQAEMVNHNFQIARNNYSLSNLDYQISSLIDSLSINAPIDACRGAVCQNA